MGIRDDDEFLMLARSVPQAKCRPLSYMPGRAAALLKILYNPTIALEYKLYYHSFHGTGMNIAEQWEFVQRHGLVVTEIRIDHFDENHERVRVERGTAPRTRSMWTSTDGKQQYLIYIYKYTDARGTTGNHGLGMKTS